MTAAVASCKKDEDGELTPSLEGYLMISGLPEFASPGEKCQLTVSGISHPKGGDITYYWKVSPSAPQACTTDVFDFTFTDTLQTVTVSCYASANGYSTASATGYATVVKSGAEGSIQMEGFPFGNEISPNNYFTEIGSQTWTANNIFAGTGEGFRGAEIMAEVFGKFYSYTQAIAACEALGSEWKLPSLEDWNTLNAYVAQQVNDYPETYGESIAAALWGNATFNGSTLMWDYMSAVGDITNKTGFSAIPVGYANIASGDFDGDYEYAAFWTSTSVSDTNAFSVYFFYGDPDMQTGSRDKESYGASVRCIRK